MDLRSRPSTRSRQAVEHAEIAPGGHTSLLPWCVGMGDFLTVNYKKITPTVTIMTQTVRCKHPTQFTD